LLPRYGLTGYFLSFLISHALNFYFSIRKLLQLITIMPSVRFFLVSTACVIAAVIFVGVFCPSTAGWSAVLVCGGMYLAFLGLLLLLTGTWGEEDHSRLTRAFGLQR